MRNPPSQEQYCAGSTNPHCSSKLFGFFTTGMTRKWEDIWKTHLQTQLPENPENHNFPDAAFPHSSFMDRFVLFWVFLVSNIYL